MKRFATLYERMDRTSSISEKVAALDAYFRTAPPADAAWALHFLTGQRLKRLLPARLLAGWAMEAVAVPDWLFEECYATVGDLAETISLLLDARPRPPGEGDQEEIPLAVWIEERVLRLKALPVEEQRARLLDWWKVLDRREVFLLVKILTGELRMGVARNLVEKALAERAGLPPATIARRLAEEWEPSALFFHRLLSSEEGPPPTLFPVPPPAEAPAEDPVPEEEAAGPRYSIDAVLVYARPGQGWQASHFTDYTFAVWAGAELVPFVKTDAGLSETEVRELDRWIRRHTVQRFGPVRAVEPVHVFEVTFERIAASPRHRSGVAVHSPRITRWRTDKSAADADTLELVQALLDPSA